ncbi:regulation of nuclear pre-mRNA domain-containing protein 1B isoform X1 [Rhodnius prolixus]|uniref:regulation of nuclear pre-mRNA domain-containing protein 1B isoform X1 n=1 Tax=Rhodnius prolixus TaxID=13249 RepID=UPI003D189741
MAFEIDEVDIQKKLEDLNESQQSIQTLSLWLIHHRKHYQLIVKTWSKEVAKGNEVQRLTLMYLANDVIQNSKRKGPEYTKEFIPVLKRAFRLIANSTISEKTRQKIERMLQIWDERMVYDRKLVDEFKRIFHKREREVEENSFQESTKKPRISREEQKPKVIERERKISEVEVDGTKELHVTLSPHSSSGDPPEVDELIKALLELENSASVDVAVREKISKLPPEVSEVKLLAKLEDKETALKLAERVNAALELLTEYNNRLGMEMDERRKVQQMLHDYTISQKQLLQQAEARLEEYKEKLIKVEQVRHEVMSHLNNLPDMKQLPDVTSGLAPLPSAGDLFT